MPQMRRMAGDRFTTKLLVQINQGCHGDLAALPVLHPADETVSSIQDPPLNPGRLPALRRRLV